MSGTEKKPTTKAYGGRKHGKYSYGNGGLGPLWSGFTGISDERWDAIFGKKEDKEEK